MLKYHTIKRSANRPENKRYPHIHMYMIMSKKLSLTEMENIFNWKFEQNDNFINP